MTDAPARSSFVTPPPHSIFDRSGKMPPHGSPSLRTCLRVQLLATSSMNANSFVSTVARDLVGEPVSARASALGAFNAQHVELADQVRKDDRAVTRHYYIELY